MNHINDANSRKRSYEAHTLEHTSSAYHNGVLGPSTSFQWHEMDYSSPNMDTTRFAPTSAPVQYTNSGIMSFSPVDYTRHDIQYTNAYSDADPSAAVQTSNLYRVGPFHYAELANIDGDTRSVSQESIYSRGTRIHSLTDSERRDSQPNSLFSSNEARRESDGFDRIFPLSSIDSETCPIDPNCPDPKCLNVSNLAPMENCDNITCISSSNAFNIPQPIPGHVRNKEHESSIHTAHSGLTSPTTLAFQDNSRIDASTDSKSRRMPRSKSAHSSIGDNTGIEKSSKLRARQAHSLVERKYRDNLNLKISQLHQTLQNVRYHPMSATRSPMREMKADYFDDEAIVSPDLPNEKTSTSSTPTGPKVRKSDVLSEAMTYVNTAEADMRRMTEEIIRLSARVKALEKMSRCENCTLLNQMVTLQMEGQQARLKQ